MAVLNFKCARDDAEKEIACVSNFSQSRCGVVLVNHFYQAENELFDGIA